MSSLRPLFLSKNVIVGSTRYCSTSSRLEDIFISPDVQRILGSLSLSSVRSKPDVVFVPEKVKRNRSKIRMMTEEEYNQTLVQALKTAQSRMQPFPVKAPRVENPQPGTLISADSELSGLTTHRHVFVDLSQTDKKNLVVIREPNGDLRTATVEERSKFTNMFCPQKQPGRSIKPPALFTNDDAHLKPLLDGSQYLYVLKRACVQFDPDDLEFIQLTSTVFDHLATSRRFDCLDATPFFSNLVFYSVAALSQAASPSPDACQRLSNLLSYLIGQDRLTDAVSVLRLCSIVNKRLFKNIPTESSKTNESILSSVFPTNPVNSPLNYVFSNEQLSELSLSLQSAFDRSKAVKTEKSAVSGCN